MILRLLATLFNLFILLSCGGNGDEGGSRKVSIAHLKSLCVGEHHRIAEDCFIEGVVVTGDQLGEFRNSIVVVDRSGGLEVAIDDANISARYPIYTQIRIDCNGLVLARIGGKIELGASSTGDFPIEGIGAEWLDSRIQKVGICEDFTPRVGRWSEIGEEDISTLLRFEGLRISAEEQGLKWCDTDEEGKRITTDRTFIDGEGVKLIVRTLGTARYADEAIPTNEIAVIGVVDYSDDHYYLRIANEWIIQ